MIAAETEEDALPQVIVVPVKPLSRVATSRPIFDDGWPMSNCSVHPAGGVIVAGLSPFPTAPIVTFPVNTAPGDVNVAAGVVDVALFSSFADWRIAVAPLFDMLATRTPPTLPDGFEPVATVTVCETAAETSESRTNALRVCWFVPNSAAVISVYVPPWSSEHVGVVFVFARTEQNTMRRSPTAGVTLAERSLVPEVAPPVKLPLTVAISYAAVEYACT